MPTSVSTVFGIVAGLNVPMPAQHANDVELRLVEVELIGETENGADAGTQRFQRGVSTFPTLGDGIYAATADDLSLVYAPRSRAAVRIGTVQQDRSLPAYIVADDLLGKHFAVLGSTGTGKSCAVALILRAMMHNYRHGHIVLLDMHNEYARAFGDSARSCSIQASSICPIGSSPSRNSRKSCSAAAGTGRSRAPSSAS